MSIAPDDEGWLMATHAATGVRGLLPENYVVIIHGRLEFEI